MDRPSGSQKPAPKSKHSSPSFKSTYLIFYNFVSATLWSAVLGEVIFIAGLYGTDRVYTGVGELVKWTQTLAALEVVHSLVGLVRAPLFTTIMQVASRFLLVWGIVHFFPAVAETNFAYITMLIAWSTTEVIRYSYFALNIQSGRVPAWLTWLRYNTFFVLYPMGISSECWLVWSAMPAARAKFGEPAAWFLWVVLAVYVPGAYILYTHMMAQRRKILRGSNTKKAK